VIFLSVSSVYASGFSSHGNSSFRHWNYDREISNFNRSREREFRRNEDRELKRIWGFGHREEMVFLHFGISGSMNSARHEAYVYYQLGNVALQQKNYAQAIVEYTTAIEIYPGLSAVYRNRGAAYYELKEFNEAIADFLKADQLASTDSSSFINMIQQAALLEGARPVFQQGLNDMHHNNDAQAIVEYSKAIEICPVMAEAYYSRGIAYYKLNDPIKAMADVNKAGELGFPVKSDLIISIKDSGNIPKSIEDLTQAIQINPTDARLYFRRGLCYKKQHNYAQAIADETTAIGLNPNYGNAFRARGNCYFLSKEYNKSWADITRAQELGIFIKPDLINQLKQALGK